MSGREERLEYWNGQKMKTRTFRVGKYIIALLAISAIAGCTGSSRFANRQFSGPPAQLEPVNSSNVSTTSLPPLLDANGNPMVQAQNGTGQNGIGQTGFPVDGQVSQDPLLANNQTQNNLQTPDGSFVAIDPTGIPTNVQSRDLSGSLTTQTMLGAWTVISGADQCRINLTQTTKQGTNRFRASAPGCPISVLAGVASWKLAGTQVQLFNDAGSIIGTLLKSGNRFIGTLSGGQGISMTG